MYRYVVFGCLAVLFFIFSFSSASGDDVEAIRETLAQTSKELNDATIKGDAETMLSFYADDAISLPNYGPMLRGKEAIRSHGQEMEKAGLQFRAIDFKTSDLWKCGDLVYEIGNYDISFCMRDTASVITDHGKYMTVWEMQPGGGLKIKVETWNTNLFPCGY